MADQDISQACRIVTRAEAKERGLARYFTGKRCKNGHRSERYFRGGSCIECWNFYRSRDLDRRRESERQKYDTSLRVGRVERLLKRAGRPKPFSCEICAGNAGGIVFDHCHASGKFRGWICGYCNRALGFAEDSPSILRLMAQYLERFSATI